MADKEATVYIIDVGHSMSQKHHGRTQSDLDWAMNYVWDKITTTMSLDRKTTLQGVIGLRTDDSENDLASNDDSFEHISVFQEIGQILMPDLTRLQNLIVPSKATEGDDISALVIAIQMILEKCKKLKYIRKIVLVTSGRGAVDTDSVTEICDQIKEMGIQLVIIGVDFDDPDYEYKEEGKDPVKAETESALKAIADICDGTFGTLVQAVEELGQPRKKSTRPVALFKGQLTLGDPGNKYGNTLSIDVERYPRIMVRKPPSSSKFVVRKEGEEATGSSTTMMPDFDGDEEEAGFDNVRAGRIYEVEDASVLGGKRTVPFEELAKGYEYGRTAVPISESDWNLTRLETKAGLEIVGFIPNDNFDRQMLMSQSCVIVAQKGNSKAAMALSSFIHALYELQSYAIARLVTKDDKPPLLVLLAPSIESDGEWECLIDAQLPFAEDVRSYRFAPLDKVVTVSGKELKEHRNLPNDDLKKAMSTYVDSMDLTAYGVEEEDGEEYAKMEDIYAPTLHYIDQAIRWRAAHPTGTVPPAADILTKYSRPPSSLLKSTRKQLDRLIKAADVKKVPPQTKSRKRKAENIKPISDLDIQSLLKTNNKGKPVHVSPENPISSFKQALQLTEDPNGIADAASQFGTIIENHVKASFGGMNDERAIEEMRMFREEMEDYEEFGRWNEWMKEFKRKLLGEELAGDRTEFWYRVRTERLGLLEETEDSPGRGGATKEEAAAFLSGR